MVLDMYMIIKPIMINDILIINAIKGPANSKKDKKLNLKPTIDKMIDTNPNNKKIYPITVTIGLSI